MDNEGTSHPALAQFAKGLADRSLNAQQVSAFQKFMEGPKCAEGTPLHEPAQLLWQRFQTEMKGQPVKPGERPQAPRPPARHFGGRPQSHPPRGLGGSAPFGGRPPALGARGPVSAPTAGRNAGAGDPSVLGEPFHNPYTFLPFPTDPPVRRAPTPLTIDEIQRDRFTGTLEILLTTLSPLLTCEPGKKSREAEHGTHAVLAIGNDVIVPSTGVRGSLRSLLSIIAGGTLGYVDDESWLCQGRDARLGPRGKTGPETTPENAFLARVEAPGNRDRDGRIRLGKTKLVRAEDLDRAAWPAGAPCGVDAHRPGNRKPTRLWTDADHTEIRFARDPGHPWELRLSGRAVNPKGKREGLFLDDGLILDVPAQLWSAYVGRNRHGTHPELRNGDLVWLEPASPHLKEITEAQHIRSLQWARWGRHGERLLDVVERDYPHLVPDSMNPDGLVDEVTDLFGQVPTERRRRGDRHAQGPSAFAARVRPDNLVFFDARPKGVERSVTLAPLAPPHPGCAAFYRDWDGNPAALDRVANHDLPLRGLKVYRTTKENWPQAPWNFATQGVYGDDGCLEESKQKVNKTCDLLKAGQPGSLRLACRALSLREVALLFAACAVDWRLGGGKPLGLGWCRVTSVRACDEDGRELWKMERQDSAPPPLPPALAALVRPSEVQRMAAWQASQAPVEKLRYPRAVQENREKKSRGGHAWFARHAAAKKTGDDRPQGLETLWTDPAGELRREANADQIRAQALPVFDPENPGGDVLYGHDLFSGDSPEFRTQGCDRRTLHRKLEPFDPARHARAGDRSSGSHGQGRDARRDERGRSRGKDERDQRGPDAGRKPGGNPGQKT